MLNKEKRKFDDYDLINSKSIGDYCRKIGHKFNTEELAVLVYRNKKMDIFEKISKYQDLIDNYPDMEVKERINCSHYDSVKKLIQNEITRITKLYQDFTAEDDCIYYSNYEIDSARKTFNEIDNEIKSLISEYNDINNFSITKKFFDGPEVIFRAKENKIITNYKVIKKIPKIIEIKKTDEDLPELEGIFVNIPVPFERGDILINKIDNGEIFVLDYLTIWNKKINDQNFVKHLDTTSMMGKGYYLIDKTPNFVQDNQMNYDSFEFYNGELRGTNRILKLISSFLKGKIDNLELFIKAYESFKYDYEREMPDIFVDKYLELAGFNDLEISEIHHEQDKIYNMPEKEKIDYIINNTNVLKDIEEENVKQIETDFDDNIFVLTMDGNLYKNTKLVNKNIKDIYMLDACHLYKVTTDNKIRPIDDDLTWNDIDIYLNNNDCSYKKILFSLMNIVALTNNGEIREVNQYPLTCIIPENYVGVEDIKIEEVDGLDIPYIYKDNEFKKLYI